MAFRICSFTSGSRGNCCLISSDNTHILIDAGISFTRLKKSLASLNLKIEDINGVVITHEHSDHIGGLGTIQKHISVYAHDLTAAAIERHGINLTSLATVQSYDVGFEIGDIYVAPFRLPHDAAYTLGYSFFYKGKKISVATDIGHITSGIVNTLSGSSIIMLESNHDLTMLKNGRYTEALKRRIMSERGHLSNEKSALAIRAALTDSLERVVLAHLSQENNLHSLAYNAAAQELTRAGVAIGKDVFVEIAPQHVQTPCFEVKR